MQKTNQKSSPVLLIAFNRPKETQQVLQRLRASGVQELFIACDAPRDNIDGEIERVDEVRNLIQQIDWCSRKEVLLQSSNLGCALAAPVAVNWFFNQVNAGIILEDDCLPASTFVSLCSLLLEKYQTQKDIWMISGYNPLGHDILDERLFLSSVPNTWGWATWKDRWINYSHSISWPDKELIQYYRKTFPLDIQNYYRSSMKAVANGNLPTAWDYQWVYLIHKAQGYAIKPYANQISNIGVHGTHSSGRDMNHFCPHGTFSLERFALGNLQLEVDRFQDIHFFFGRIDSLPIDYLKRAFARLRRLLHAN